MPLFLDTRGKRHAAIAICDRCRFKFAYDDLKPDRHNRALRVCDDCNDGPDPHRLPPRKTEKITLRYPRPEEDLT
jgi:hypothetical protein